MSRGSTAAVQPLGVNVTTVPDLDSAALARLVSRVTRSMCGIEFEPLTPTTLLPNNWRMAVLPIPGVRPIEVVLFSDEPSCRALAAAMFGMTLDAIEEDLIEDAFRELLNMAAGQIKSALVPDQLLGLPRIVRESELAPERRRVLFDGVVMGSRGNERLFIAVLGNAGGASA